LHNQYSLKSCFRGYPTEYATSNGNHQFCQKMGVFWGRDFSKAKTSLTHNFLFYIFDSIEGEFSLILILRRRGETYLLSDNRGESVSANFFPLDR